MKKLNKKDLLYISLSIIVFLLTISIIYTKNFLHTELTLITKEITTIEYLRNLYYSNFNLFPDFAFNIGNGQNIYYLAEYGLLSPITLISYLLPFLSIKTYLTIITIISPIISTILLYRFFHNKKHSSEICFIISILFISLGILIVSLVSEKGTGGIGSIIVQLVCFTSGMYFSKDLVGKVFATICEILPFESCLNIIRAILNNDISLISTRNIIVFSLYTIVVFITSIIVFKKKMVSDNK